jgi:hypothetical protein
MHVVLVRLVVQVVPELDSEVQEVVWHKMAQE